MADLNELNSAGMTKIIGSDASGQETNPVDATPNRELKTAISGTLDDAATTAASEDSTAPVRITPQRAVHSNLRNQAGTEVGTATDPVRVDPTGTTTQPISAVALPLPAGAATSANQSTEITSLQLIDDIPHAQNAALSKGVPMMGQLDDVATTAATENNVAVPRITPQRAVHANIRDQAGAEFGTSGNPIYTNTNFTVVGGQLVPTITNKFRVRYSTTPATVVAAYSTVYTRSGTGLFFGFQLDFNSANISIRLTIDGGQVFEVILNDIKSFQFNDTSTTRMQMGGFWSTVGNTLDFSSKYAIPYASSVLIEVKRSDGTNHTMNQYMVFLTEDT